MSDPTVRAIRAFELAPVAMAVCQVDGTILHANRAARALLAAATTLQELTEVEVHPLEDELAPGERLVELRPRAQGYADYHALFDKSPLPLFVYDVETLRYLAVNDAAVRHYGYSRDEFLAMTVLDIRPAEDVAPLQARLATHGPGNEPMGVWRHRKSDGTIFEVEISSHSTQLGARRARLIIATDLTARQREEGERLQAQKMEALGRLAGGIAHDFNNVLSIILGSANLALADLPLTHPVRPDLEQIEEAGQRAAELTARLLTFSRQQVVQPRLVDLAALITGMEQMLRRLLGGGIQLALALRPCGRVLADPSQLEQLVLNLVVNARDAMPAGGQVTVELREVASAAARHAELVVTDTGVGMDEVTQRHAFEPFFTTKAAGRGTGLGLATVYGVCEQLGGTIALHSAVGAGTTFTITLPVSDASDRPSAPTTAVVTTLEGDEVVLVVEDDEQLRGVIGAALRRRGYTVHEAANAGEALLIAEQHLAIALLLTDVVLPRMSGVELARRLVELRPGLRVLYMSGHDPAEVLRTRLGESPAMFLAKPFTPPVLLAKLRATLAGPAGA